MLPKGEFHEDAMKVIILVVTRGKKMTPQILYGVLSQAYFKNADNYEKVYSF